MPLKFRKPAIKTLQKLSPEDASKIKVQLQQLMLSIEEKSIIPFTELNIKKMRGDWEGFYRLRIGKIRIIFRVNLDTSDIEIYTIGFRGDVYR